MVEIDSVTREGVPVAGSIDTAPTEFLRFLIGQVPPVALVEHTVCECATGTNGKEIALETRPIRVNVEDGGALSDNSVSFPS